MREAGGRRRGRNGNLRIEDFRFQIAHSGEPALLRKKLNHEGHYWSTKALTVLVEMSPAECEIEAAAGSFDFVRLAPHFAQDDKQREEPKDDTQDQRPKTVDQAQIILALFPVSLLSRPQLFPVSLLSRLFTFPVSLLSDSLLSDSLLCQA